VAARLVAFLSTGGDSMKRAALYARVSTDDHGQNPETQLLPLREYARRAGWEWADYADHVSGARPRRPQLDLVLRKVRARQLDVLAVTRLDRLARSLHLLLELLAELKAYGCDLVVTEQQIDTTTPGGRLFLQMIGAFAEFERALAADRTRDGMARARAEGKRIGRPAAQYDRKELRARFERGESLSAIGRALGVDRTTVKKGLRDLGLIPKDLRPAAVAGE